MSTLSQAAEIQELGSDAEVVFDSPEDDAVQIFALRAAEPTSVSLITFVELCESARGVEAIKCYGTDWASSWSRADAHANANAKSSRRKKFTSIQGFTAVSASPLALKHFALFHAGVTFCNVDFLSSGTKDSRGVCELYVGISQTGAPCKLAFLGLPAAQLDRLRVSRPDRPDRDSRSDLVQEPGWLQAVIVCNLFVAFACVLAVTLVILSQVTKQRTKAQRHGTVCT